MLTKPEKLQAFTRLQGNKGSTMNFYGGSVEGIVNFDTRCATFTLYTFILITSLYVVYNAKLAFLNRPLVPRGSSRATVNFHHGHFIDPTNCPWVSEDG